MSTMKNSVMLIGKPVNEPKFAEISESNKVARFCLKVTECRRNAMNELVEDSQWFSIVSFGHVADRVRKLVHNGTLVAIEGTLRNNEWTSPQGERHCDTEIYVNDLFVIGEDNKED